MKCTHYACRSARAAELALQSDLTGRIGLLADAVAIHSQEVECRAMHEECGALSPEETRR
jgi:hypothetical protein